LHDPRRPHEERNRVNVKPARGCVERREHRGVGESSHRGVPLPSEVAVSEDCNMRDFKRLPILVCVEVCAHREGVNDTENETAEIKIHAPCVGADVLLRQAEAKTRC
jgi:hypothetical protein